MPEICEYESDIIPADTHIPIGQSTENAPISYEDEHDQQVDSLFDNEPIFNEGTVEMPIL